MSHRPYISDRPAWNTSLRAKLNYKRIIWYCSATRSSNHDHYRH